MIILVYFKNLFLAKKYFYIYIVVIISTVWDHEQELDQVLFKQGSNHSNHIENLMKLSTAP